MEGQVVIKPKPSTIVQFTKAKAAIVFQKDIALCKVNPKLGGKVEVEYDRT